ncbi:MAG: Dipeptidyl-peptidase 6 [Bacteroidetes bacterium ADurb.BinA174]|jgi:cell wall-associated NlpC family hydrolase|nr:MAG: Dipeptidyl-peptidase 6 [Bacteroidetes bacterium ADurb.BinA174]
MRKATFLILLWIFSTLCTMAQNSNTDRIIQIVQEKYAPDRRVVVFDIKSLLENDAIVLEGETSHPDAYNDLLKQVTGNVKNNIRLLPDEVIGEKKWGVIYNSVEKLHASNSYGSETVSEVLLGTPLRLLDKKGGWRRVQAPEGYIGWVSEAIKTMTEAELHAYNQKPKVVVTSLYVLSYEKADAKSQTVSNLVIGDMLVLKGTKGKFYQVTYPDGREAYIQKSDAKELKKWLKDIEFTQGSIVRTGKQFMGVPYVWGGTSSKGLDCSGFTKLVYFLHGVILQRDASQQVLNGKLIDEKGDFSNAQKGDLVFFGTKATPENPKERVVHVGIYIGDMKFIHASDYIRINSFDPADPLYDEYNTNRYLRTKRIIGEVGTKGIERIFENEFYK